jgi:tetratricopeptide (TPR) repeat protein
LRPLVEDLGWYELTGDLGEAVLLAGQAHEYQGHPQAALDAYRTARGLFEDAVIRDGQLDLTSGLARSCEYEATWIGVLEDPRSAVIASEHAVDLWRRLVTQDGLAAWAPQLASAYVSLGRKLTHEGDQEHAMERFDDALRVMNEAQPGPAWSFIIAQVHLGRGYVLRMARRPGEAAGEYQLAFKAIDGMAGEEDVHTRAGILQSLSSIYGDSGNPGEALRLLRMSIADIESFSEPGRARQSATIRSDLADAYQRCANKLATLGQYPQACDAATRGLAVYEKLVREGRRDLALQTSRLQGAYGLILEQLGDLDGAIAALSTSRETLTQAGTGATTFRDLMGPAAPAVTIDAMVEGMDSMLADLRQRRREESG